MLSQQHLCQKLPKSYDVRRNYSVQHQRRFFETQRMHSYVYKTFTTPQDVIYNVRLTSVPVIGFETLTSIVNLLSMNLHLVHEKLQLP